MTILDTAAALFSDDLTAITAADILSRSRSVRIVAARHAVAYALREAGLTLSEIGDILHRDHTTIISAVEHARDLGRQNATYAARLRALVASATARQRPEKRPKYGRDNPVWWGCKIVRTA